MPPPRTLRQILNKLVWDERERLVEYEITFIHRGAPRDRMTVPCSIITKIGPSWFTYKSREEEAIIPFHRIIEIRNVKTDRLLWGKKP